MSDWSGFGGKPLAPNVGPFADRPFLEVCARRSDGDLHIASDGGNAMALIVSQGCARFVGEQHLTDYHSPLGTRLDGLVTSVVQDLAGVGFDLDSLPVEAAEPLGAAFEAVGRAVECVSDEPCRVLHLDAGHEDSWEGALDSKDRHEVRRKRRRYEREAGAPTVVDGRDYFDTFVTLHRLSVGDKGEFMTEEMESFFSELLDIPGARLDVLLTDDRATAAAFGFEDAEGYYLYNSAYDPALRELSPGIVLIDRLIVRTIQASKGWFDFLKGAETYKRRLGAVERPLFRLKVAP